MGKLCTREKRTCSGSKYLNSSPTPNPLPDVNMEMRKTPSPQWGQIVVTKKGYRGNQVDPPLTRGRGEKLTRESDAAPKVNRQPSDTELKGARQRRVRSLATPVPISTGADVK